MNEEKIIEQYHNLVAKMIWKYASWAIIPFEDLMQEGYIGLIVAYRKFDPDKGVKFITYATWWVRQRILLAVRKDRGKCKDLVIDEAIMLDNYCYVTPYEEVNTKITMEKVQKQIDRLNDKERAVLNYRYPTDGTDGLAFRTIGDRMRLSGQRIEQIDKLAINKLREAI